MSRVSNTAASARRKPLNDRLSSPYIQANRPQLSPVAERRRSFSALERTASRPSKTRRQLNAGNSVQGDDTATSRTTAPIYPVILSGGSGTRLWPLSRSMYPKQFIRFFAEQDCSFLGATLRRLPCSEGFEAPILLCNKDHRFLIKEELEEAGLEPKAVVLEPVARNTAAAIAVAALVTSREDANAIITVMPSDHVITDPQTFSDRILAASKIAATERLVLLGIAPTEPHTGYGYIEKGETLEGHEDAFAVDAFCEKPDSETAQAYLETGHHFWNSGIFVLHAKSFLKELKRLSPQSLSAARASLEAAQMDLGNLLLDKDAFSEAPNVSIDYAVMEHTDLAAMLPLDVGWNDVGSWSSLWNLAPRDEARNYANCDAVIEDSQGCYIHSERALVSTIGVKDLVIVDTPDALLVADRSRAQDVSSVVKRLKEQGRKEQDQHIRNFRPWGYFETLSLSDRFQVKKLHVKPGAKLSMQMHHHRSEHWIVVQGTGKVVIGDMEKLVRENESVYIFATQWHRLENPGKVPLELIEVQIGTYLGEDDIIRTDDIYHREADETK
ncbi:MAG: mannose-1-phosphate guanylyltransferase/mannose-6-phosphate isomerase [Alphaproteobacteria bacterium]|nr:mannose-1-phosphate guanylyltransferase/mannose-6-phosphate isomerase [Alphaproteobacteria bacterium]